MKTSSFDASHHPPCPPCLRHPSGWPLARKIVALFIALLAGCLGLPENLEPVNEFDVQRYLGTWYEIARLDHSFERGLERVTATYSLRDDGGLRVINKGFDPIGNRWKEAEGKAFFIDRPAVGRLKVSFFGPFYGAYNIIDLDKDNYQYALVCGPSRSYLWILSRTPDMRKELQDRLIAKAKALNFRTEGLIFVKQ